MARQNYLLDGLFGFEGRFRRSEYWIASIGLSVVNFVVLAVASAMMGMSIVQTSQTLWVRLGVNAIFLWPSAAIAIKRGHDRNRSALYTGVLLAFINVASVISVVLAGAGQAMTSGVVGLIMFPVLIYMFVDYGCIDGTKGPNRYGASPKGHQGVGAEVARAFD